MALKRCLDCNAEFPAAGKRRRCAGCQPAFVKRRAREYRAVPAVVIKNEARRAVTNAIRVGNLIPRACEHVNTYTGFLCNRTPTQAHHEDYLQPLEVAWLCSSCHSFRHCYSRPPLSYFRPGMPQADRDW